MNQYCPHAEHENHLPISTPLPGLHRLKSSTSMQPAHSPEPGTLPVCLHTILGALRPKPAAVLQDLAHGETVRRGGKGHPYTLAVSIPIGASSRGLLCTHTAQPGAWLLHIQILQLHSQMLDRCTLPYVTRTHRGTHATTTNPTMHRSSTDKAHGTCRKHKDLQPVAVVEQDRDSHATQSMRAPPGHAPLTVAPKTPYTVVWSGKHALFAPC